VKIIVSYTSSDRAWAQWIGWQLQEAGHEPFIHDWEIGAGENIAGWMEQCFKEADRLIGIFSDAYCDAKYSQSERWAAYWKDPRGRTGFLIPIEVRDVSNWPELVSPLKRLSLVGLSESEASAELTAFLQPANSPTVKPVFPGISVSPPTSVARFTDGSEPLGAIPPTFPALASINREPTAVVMPPIAASRADLDPSIHCIDDHEPKPQIFGRDDEVETIVNAVLEGKMILVAGGPGMGKTAAATAAFYDPRILPRFGRRRVFASLETATEPRAILAKLVEALGLPPTGDEVSLLRIIESNATERPLAAILDNAETVFDTNRGTAERLLKLVAQIRGLSLVVTIRGVAPPIPGAVQIDNLGKLDPSAAREAFLAVAGEIFRCDPDLSHLLEALDGHALSIRLVAAQAIGSPSLKGLRESWDEVHSEILRVSGEDEGRLTSVRASLSLSLNSRRMKSTPLARRLMALIAFLPSGLAESDAPSLLGERGAITKLRANEAVSCLHQLRLVERRPDRRLRMLTPLRECVKNDVGPLEVDRERLTERYLRLAARAATIGTPNWAKYRESVEGEADNLDAICEFAVATNITHKNIQDAIGGLLRFHLFSGRGSAGSVEHALAKLRRHPPSVFLASCIRGQGDIARANSNYETSRLRYEEARTLFRYLKDLRNEANCIFRLGDLAMLLSDYETARIRVEEALLLYQKFADPLGSANSFYVLGAIALARRNHNKANAYFTDALALYQLHDFLGKGNVLHRLGELALLQSDGNMARAHVEEALLIYRLIGNTLGEANCIRILGDIANAALDFSSAVKRYDEARLLFRFLGDVSSEAYSTIKLGKVQRRGQNEEQGLANIELGFGLYFKISNASDLAFPGWQAMHRAFTCGDKVEMQKYRGLAKSSWTAIGRLDLVHEWVQSE
jgi:tetratricopeptide (TPR) repeat protein